MVIFDPRQRAPAPRTRRDQIARIRTRLDGSPNWPSDERFTRLLGIVKGIMDIIEDDGREGGE